MAQDPGWPGCACGCRAPWPWTSSGGAGDTPHGWRSRAASSSPSGFVRHQSAGDLDDLFRSQAHVPQMVVVAVMEVGVIGLLRTLLAHALHLAQHLGHELGLRPYPCFTERMLDDDRPRMLAVHVVDLGPHVRRRKDLVHGGVIKHPARLHPGLLPHTALSTP